MNIVIPFAGSGIELKYTLRSITKHVTGLQRLIVIGDKPDWYTGEHIPHQVYTNQAWKKRDMLEKTLLSPVEEFYRFSDDYYLMEDFTGCPYYSNGTLYELYNRYTEGNLYRSIVHNTKGLIGASASSFDVHAPILMQKEVLKEMHSRYDWKVEYGYLIRSLYGFMVKAGPIPYEDLIIRRGDIPIEQLRSSIKDRDCFSVGEYGFVGNVLTLLEELYPEHSEWELEQIKVESIYH